MILLNLSKNWNKNNNVKTGSKKKKKKKPRQQEADFTDVTWRVTGPVRDLKKSFYFICTPTLWLLYYK